MRSTVGSWVYGQEPALGSSVCSLFEIPSPLVYYSFPHTNNQRSKLQNFPQSMEIFQRALAIWQWLKSALSPKIFVVTTALRLILIQRALVDKVFQNEVLSLCKSRQDVLSISCESIYVGSRSEFHDLLVPNW